jgi:sugar phosphate permease
MVLIGIGQGGTLAPLTSAGIAGVAGEDAGAASGVVNAAHQLGASLGLGILVTVFASAGGATQLAHGVAVALTAGSAMIAAALILVLALIVRPRNATTVDPRSRADRRSNQPARAPEMV